MYQKQLDIIYKYVLRLNQISHLDLDNLYLTQCQICINIKTIVYVLKKNYNYSKINTFQFVSHKSYAKKKIL